MKILNYLLLISIACLIYSCSGDPDETTGIDLLNVNDVSITAPGTATSKISIENSGIAKDDPVYLKIEDVPNNVSYTFSDNGKVIPYETTITFTAQSDAAEGDYELTLKASYVEDFVDAEAAFTNFNLSISKEETSNTECGEYLEGQYSGPDTCAPQGFGDVAVDLVYITQGDTIKLNHEFFSTEIVGTLDCDNETFTIPSQNVTYTGGTQTVTISGEGTVEISTDTSLIFLYTTEYQGNSLFCRADLEK